MNSKHDLPTGRQIEEAWRRVEAALHARRPVDRRLPWEATAEERRCYRG